MTHAASIVLIDDNPLLTDAYGAALRAAGREVQVAHDGADGIVLVKQIGPDLVLLDMRLRDMDGIAVLQILQQDDTTKSIPVVVFTMSDDEALKECALALGARSYYRKSQTSIADLVKHIDAVVGYDQGHRLLNTH